MLVFCTTYLLYLENLIPFLIKAIGIELLEIYDSI
jgi:hypothetical protein